MEEEGAIVAPILSSPPPTSAILSLSSSLSRRFLNRTSLQKRLPFLHSPSLQLKPSPHFLTPRTPTLSQTRSLCAHHFQGEESRLTSLAKMSTNTGDGEENRLGKTVTPTHYDLTIRTDLQSLKFYGSAEIILNITEATSSIIINAGAPLHLKAAVLSSTSLKTEALRPATSIEIDTKRERAEIKFAGGEIAAGMVKLGLRWECPLESSMMGYYASAYPTKDGVKGSQSYYGLT
ncbi:hypothetical protein P7C70_g9606, partial [Phenoliferia sp. Uapishka_3]